MLPHLDGQWRAKAPASWTLQTLRVAVHPQYHSQRANNFDYCRAKYIAFLRLLRLFAAVFFAHFCSLCCGLISRAASSAFFILRPLGLGEGVGIAAIFRIHGISETRQGRTRRRIAHDSLPGQISRPLRHERRQVLNQLGSVAGRKATNGRFDLLQRTHAPTLAA